MDQPLRPAGIESRRPTWLGRVAQGALGLLVAGLLPMAPSWGQEPARAQADAPPIPHADLSALEAPVAAQIEGTRTLLRQVLDNPSAPDAEKAEAYGDLGRLYHAYQLTEPAAACYLNAGRLSPRDFRWAYLLAYLHQGAGSFEEAVRYYLLALELNPGNVPALTRLGDAYLELNQAAKAEEALRAVLAVAPGNLAATALLGQVALSRQDYGQAASLLGQALAQAPGANRLHYPLGLAYRGLGEMDKAREHLALRGEVGVRPIDPLVEEMEELREGERIHLLRGRTAFRAGAYEQAAVEFTQAVEAKPDSTRARVNLGTALAAAGDAGGAALQFQAALELDPTNETAHYNLGALFADEGKLEAAARHLREAVRLQPADGAAHHRLADVLRAMGNPDEALEHYGQAITLNSANPLLRVRQASLLIALERYQEAATRLSEAYGFLPREPLVVNAYARFLAACPVESLRDGEEALELAAEMYELQPTVAHATTLAMALGEVGRCSEAAELQGKAVAVAQGAGQADLAAQLRETQTRYQSGPPCRYPTQP